MEFKDIPKDQILEKTRQVALNHLRPHSFGHEVNPTIIRDILEGRFWHVLPKVNSLNAFLREETLNLVVNQALKYTPEICAPGHDRPNTLLYQSFIEEKVEEITPEFENKLLNGMFWENWGSAIYGLNHGYHIKRLRYILDEKSEELNPEYDWKPIVQRFRNVPSMQGFTNKEMKNYAGFVKKMNLDSDDTALLINPYITGAMSYDRDWCKFKSYKTMFRRIKKFLNNDKVQQHVASELTYWTNYHPQHFNDILELMPKENNVMDYFMDIANSRQAIEFIVKAKEKGYNIKKYL